MYDKRTQAIQTTDMMSSAERTELAKVVRMRAKLAKGDIDQRHKHLLADAEAQLALNFSREDVAWRTIVTEAEASIADVNARIHERCDELGVPQEFRPSYNSYWLGRGENAKAARRAELRRVAQTRLAERAAGAKLEVDRQATNLATQIIAGGLRSGEARDFLATMPSAEELLPPLTMLELGKSDEE